MPYTIREYIEDLKSEKKKPPCVNCTEDKFSYCEQTGKSCGDFKSYAQFGRVKKVSA